MNIDTFSLLEDPHSVFERYDIEICFDGFLGSGYLKVQSQLSVAMNNDADVEQNVPVSIEKDETKELKADGSSSETFNPFSRAALKGMDRETM